MPWTEHPRVVAARGRWMPVDLAVGVLDGFRRHITGRNAAVLAYYGVLTLFPLLMAATTILGFVLEDDPELQRKILDSALAQIPVVGDSIQEQAGNIGGSWAALIVGLLGAMWGSLKAFVGAQTAFDDTWEVPVDDRANMFVKRGRALIGVTVIGGAQVGNVVLASLVGYAGLPRLGQIAITFGGFAINVVVLASMFRFLTSKRVGWTEVWPGALLGGATYTLLQFAGTNIMTRAFASAEGVYGDFAGLLALMTWISIHALVALVGAELNATVVDRRAGRLTLNRMFVYGSLLPGQSNWNVIEPWVASVGETDAVAGALYDTGLGWPAAVFDGTPEPDSPRVVGRVVELKPDTIAVALAELDEFEGIHVGDYARIEVVTDRGVAAWAYHSGNPGDAAPVESGDWAGYLNTQNG